MADSNKVFVSPGVYTSEKDLTFVAQSVGVTTLGLVGETLKGPAFEPILITNFDEFRRYFGNCSPVKDGNGNPKYELPYVAKSYLQESNQLFVTRILGLTGYLPGKSYGIKTLGGINYKTIGVDTEITNLDPNNITGNTTLFSELSGKTSVDGSSITDYIIKNFSGYTSGQTGNWFVIGKPVEPFTNPGGTEIISPYTGKYNIDSNHGKEWYNVFFNNGDDINSLYSYVFVWNDNQFDVTRYVYPASVNTEYQNIIVASLRSRGKYSGSTLNYELTENSSFTLSKTTNSDITTNPFADFVINVTGTTSGVKSFTCSLDGSSTKYITKVLGTDVFDKSNKDFPVYINEVYPNFLSNAYNQGLIRGLSLDVAYNSEYNSILKRGTYAESWDTPISPVVVSEVRGNKVDDLFEIITISDGESGNYEVKISIVNINLETGEFDLLVRDFYDTDENMVVLEKYSRCSMNPDVPGYIAKKIGTSDTEYELRSKYIMLKLNPNHPIDAIPAGFKGYTNNTSFSGCTLGSSVYKTKYYDAGETVGYEPDGTPITTNGDKIRKVTLGISSQKGLDNDLLKYKGNKASGSTKGFHLSTNASGITVSGVTVFETTPYDLEGQTNIDNVPNKLTNINYRKFTFVVFGGHDGWDIYRNVRTYGDEYIFGKTTYNALNTQNGGLFNKDYGTSDYYSYLKGIETYANPEAIDINVFATPGINFFDHSSLTSLAIDMVETDRADSIYIMSSKNRDTTDEVVDDIDFVGIDSNYSATYWPWIQIRDTDNATQLYVPPTGEVCRNIALTDNVSYPWFAVAGYSRGLVNSVKAFKKLTLSDRDVLYKNRINPIATFSDTGTIIWGNKTLQVRESALDRINVRRLLLRARKLISAVSVRLLFEQDDEQVKNEFLRLVNPILESIKKERGLYEFRVVVSNDPEDIDANTLRGKIYIKPTRSLEFIDVEFIITPTGASFENI